MGNFFEKVSILLDQNTFLAGGVFFIQITLNLLNFIWK